MAKTEIINNDAVTVRLNEEPVKEVVDLIEDQVDLVATVTKNNPVIVFGALAVGLGIGGFIAYRIASKRTELRYEEILQEEIAKAKEFYKRQSKAEEYSTPEGAAAVLVPEEAVSALSTYQGQAAAKPYNRPEDIVVAEVVEEQPQPVVHVEKAVVTQNVFGNTTANPHDWDYQAEIAGRDTTKPYVISREEFEENEESHEQGTLMYYSVDDVLTDEKDTIIDDVENTVGDDNLQRFGHGSGDRKVVYVRNERVGMDWEIIRSERSFAEMMGFPEPSTSELRHSHRRRASRRDRGTDE